MERLVVKKASYPVKNAIIKGQTYMDMLMPEMLKNQARKEIAERGKKR